MKKFFLLFVLISGYITAYSQVGIMPPVIYIDSQTRSGEYEIFNSSSEEREIEVNFKFGYSDTDSLGNIFINYTDKKADNYSLLPYIKAFPKKFILPGNGQQTVRFLLVMPNNLPDGTYWTRIVTRSSPIQKQIDTANIPKGEVKAGFVFVTEFINMIVFQKGKVHTELSIGSPRIHVDSNKVNILMNMIQNGNSPSWATVKIKIKDESGNAIDDINDNVAVYFNSVKKFSFDKNKFKPGKYKADIVISSERKDIPEDKWTRFKTIETNFTFEYKN